jgi:pimeloyl-ACP methyl ester carboxylesterase
MLTFKEDKYMSATINTNEKNTTSTVSNHKAGEHLTPPIGRLYNIGGQNLFFHRSGIGGPAVVFLPGGGMPGLDFLNIHNQISQFTTSVIYDRSGTGWSDQLPLPRTATEVTDELQSLLHETGVPGPYLLVGHSLGGAYAQRYAQRFPDEVAGLLLLEPSHEDFYVHMPMPTLREQLQAIPAILRLLLHFKTFYRNMFNQMFASWPEEVREPLLDWHLKNLTKTMQEWPASDRSGKGKLMTELRNGGKRPDVPLIVLVATGIDPSMAATMSEPYLHRLTEGKCIHYKELAASVPRGEYRELENAGHTAMHIDCPDAVVQAIRDLIERIKS